ncbi:hypothetical protein AYI69_g7765 [Smittium culicis]|uniref:Uncharacterized protein n=1 Tax=Smittium culicis TaxID=133412 RepID=A0A1R1XPR1_9FUNG|nr:hypothetical protein AYI69_g7765 [Smittium culicis]
MSDSEIIFKNSILGSIQKRDEWTTTELKKATFIVLLFTAIAVGSVCGILGVKGAAAIITFLLVEYVNTAIYWRKYLDININDFGTVSEFFTENIAPSVSSFLVR